MVLIIKSMAMMMMTYNDNDEVNNEDDVNDSDDDNDNDVMALVKKTILIIPFFYPLGS